MAVLPGEPVELMAGLLYGTWGGLALCLFGRGPFQRRSLLLRAMPREPEPSTLPFWQNTIFCGTRRTWFFFVPAVFIPGTPKDVLIYLGPFLPVRPHAFFLISTLARIPSVITSTFAGSQFAEGSWDVSLVVFLATGAVAGLCVIFQDRILAGIAAEGGNSV